MNLLENNKGSSGQAQGVEPISAPRIGRASEHAKRAHSPARHSPYVANNIFERLVVEAVEVLPLRVREAMKNVAIVIEQEPRWKKESEIGIKRQEVLLGLYEGIPLTGRDSGYFGALPDKITIFQKPIEILSEGSEERVIALVREVVWHEIGHHFGLSDREISILEKKRKKTEI